MNIFVPLVVLVAAAAHSPAADAAKTAAAKVTAGHSAAGAGFKIDPIPAPAINDAAAKAKFTLISGDRDGNGGDLAVLHDGAVPDAADSPRANFFLSPRSQSGRIAVDLGSVAEVATVASYSWHPDVRGPQVYRLFAADGSGDAFKEAPSADTDPAACGWTLVASVDTRPAKGSGGGQHAVSISGDAPLGKFRYLLFDVQKSSATDGFGQTFFSEIDVATTGGPPLERIKPRVAIVKEFPTADGKCRFTVDATDAPDLMPWVQEKLIPVVHEWYPKMVTLLPSEGYTAPDAVLLEFKSNMPQGVPAYAAGNRVSLSTPWFRTQLNGEARGCVVHELVHVVQNYWRASVTNPRGARTPGWVTEGIPDYIRWFLYEPESGGARLRGSQWAKVNYDQSYRITANFFDWVTRTHGKDIIPKLNAAAREGKYNADLWKEWTGQTLTELDAAWKKAGSASAGE